MVKKQAIKNTQPNTQITIYETEGELDPKSVVEEYSITAADGKEYKTKRKNETL